MVATVILIASLCIVRFPISSIVYRMPQQQFILTFYVFLSTGMIAGLARFVFDGGSAEQYFLNSSLIFGAIMTSCSVFHLTSNAATNVRNGLLPNYRWEPIFKYCYLQPLPSQLRHVLFLSKGIAWQ
jgi:hypothetical protein